MHVGMKIVQVEEFKVNLANLIRLQFSKFQLHVVLIIGNPGV